MLLLISSMSLKSGVRLALILVLDFLYNILLSYYYYHYINCIQLMKLQLVNIVSIPVFACLSLPARSTRFNFATRMWASPLSSSSQRSRWIVKIEWLRDDSAFIIVEPTERFFQPFSITFSQSKTFLHRCIDSSTTCIQSVSHATTELYVLWNL